VDQTPGKKKGIRGERQEKKRQKQDKAELGRRAIFGAGGSHAETKQSTCWRRSKGEGNKHGGWAARNEGTKNQPTKEAGCDRGGRWVRQTRAKGSNRPCTNWSKKKNPLKKGGGPGGKKRKKGQAADEERATNAKQKKKGPYAGLRPPQRANERVRGHPMQPDSGPQRGDEK